MNMNRLMRMEYRPGHMKTLYNLCVAPKAWRSFPEGSHNDTFCEEGYFDEILDFVEKVIRGAPVDVRKGELK